jgi:tetratricopeptide (TPR) repeat protein
MYREAVLAFKKSADIEPNDPRTYYNCGLTLGKVGRLEEAAIFFKQALELKPDFAEAQEKLKLTRSILSAAGKK